MEITYRASGTSTWDQTSSSRDGRLILKADQSPCSTKIADHPEPVIEVSRHRACSTLAVGPVTPPPGLKRMN